MHFGSTRDILETGISTVSCVFAVTQHFSCLYSQLGWLQTHSYTAFLMSVFPVGVVTNTQLHSISHVCIPSWGGYKHTVTQHFSCLYSQLGWLQTHSYTAFLMSVFPVGVVTNTQLHSISHVCIPSWGGYKHTVTQHFSCLYSQLGVVTNTQGLTFTGEKRDVPTRTAARLH